LAVATGVTVATCTAEPLVCPPVFTTAVRLPAVVGFASSVTVNAVLVAEVTMPTAPLLNVTVLLLAVELNPAPLMVIVAASAAKFAMLLVTLGDTVAT
jgi:hypothetical protein